MNAERHAARAPERAAFWHAITLRAVVIGATIAFMLGGVSAPGCADGGGGLTLRDASEGCNTSEGRLAQPVAVGARLDVAVDRGERPPTIVDAVVSDGAIFEVVAVDNPVVLRARAAGTTIFEVTDAGGRSVSTDLRAAPIVAATLAPDPLTVVWILDIGLELADTAPVDALFPGPFALLADAEVRVDVAYQAAYGVDLIGWDVATWVSDPAGAVTFEPAAELVDHVLVSPSAGTGAVTVSPGHGASWTLFLSDSDASALEVWIPDDAQRGGSLSLGVGEVKTVTLLAFDADGRLLLGNGAGGFSADPPAAATFRLVPPPWAEPQGEVPLDEAGEAFLERLRVVYVEGLAAGSDTLRLSAAGRTLEVPVTVTP